MKKLVATIALGTLLVGGFFITNNDNSHQAIEVEPSVFSIGNDSTF